jgi:putative nucleic acid binding protein/TonB-like protein
MKTFLAFVGAVVVGFFLIVFFVAHSSNNPTSNTAVTQADPDAGASSASNEPSIDVTPYRLYADYHRNEVSADSMYKGRTLKLNGIVESINKDALNEMYLVLEDGNEFSGVDAKLQSSEAAKAGQLSRGEEVTLVCKGGTMIVGTPMLDDCFFSRPVVVPEQVAPTQSSASFEQAAAEEATPVQAIPAVASNPPLSEDEYQDKFLSVMQSHWVVPAGVPVNTNAEMKVDIAPDGRLYNAAVAEPSGFPALDQSCLAALQQMVAFDPTTDGKGMELNFGCRVKQ